MWVLENCATQEEYVLFCGKWTLGRGSSSNIHVSINSVSRQHLRFDVDNRYDPTDPSSLMKLTITDISSKRVSRWNGERILTGSELCVAFTSITLFRESEQGILFLSNLCSFSLHWEPHVVCFSKISGSQKKSIQSELNTLGFHFLPSYISKQIQFLIVTDIFDITPKLLQSLIDCIPVVTPSFVTKLMEDHSKLQFPDIKKYIPIESFAGVNLYPQLFRQTVFYNCSFHFLPPDSLFRNIVPLAGGVVDTSTYVTETTSNRDYVVFQDNVEPLKPRARRFKPQVIAMSREISEEVLEWVRAGWIPLEEQELMQCLLFDGRFNELTKCGIMRRAKERTRKHKSRQISKQSLDIPTDLKRPEPPSKLDEVDEFFNELDASMQTTEQSVFYPVKRKDVITDLSGDGDEESKQATKGKTGTAQKKKATRRKDEMEEEYKPWTPMTSRSGKQFVKTAVRKSTRIINLHPHSM